VSTSRVPRSQRPRARTTLVFAQVSRDRVSRNSLRKCLGTRTAQGWSYAVAQQQGIEIYYDGVVVGQYALDLLIEATIMVKQSSQGPGWRSRCPVHQLPESHRRAALSAPQLRYVPHRDQALRQWPLNLHKEHPRASAYICGRNSLLPCSEAIRQQLRPGARTKQCRCSRWRVSSATEPAAKRDGLMRAGQQPSGYPPSAMHHSKHGNGVVHLRVLIDHDVGRDDAEADLPPQSRSGRAAGRVVLQAIKKLLEQPAYLAAVSRPANPAKSSRMPRVSIPANGVMTTRAINP
jgi:hypothetical protein